MAMYVDLCRYNVGIQGESVFNVEPYNRLKSEKCEGDISMATDKDSSVRPSTEG